MFPILLLAIAILIVCQFYFFIIGKPKNSPPGPLRLPVWGSYWLLLWGDYRFPYKTMKYYIEKYKSKIISLYLGDVFVVVVNDYESVREVLRRKEFDGRLHENWVLRARAFGKKLGIFFNDDADWLTQRRFALRHLRDFGFGRRHEKLESIVNQEMSTFVDILLNGPINQSEKALIKDSLVLFPDALYASCANAIWFVMTGETYDREDHEKLRAVSRKAMMFQRNAETTGGALTLTPWLKYFGNLFGYEAIMDSNYSIVDFFKNFLRKREADPLPEDEIPQGFIDVYLNRLKECGEFENFSEQQLLIVCTDVIFPAISAVPSTLTHFIKFMMHHPEVLKKVQREIDEIVGRGRLPEWGDRNKLVYTEATMREALRMETLTPWSVIHRSIEATTLMGYDIPCDTAIVTNLSFMHHDPDLWKDPENFRPERFLTEDGLELNKDYSLPFGLGRRVCAGETFARFELFSHFAVLVQNFNFEFVDGEPTRLDDVLPGLIVTPKETWIRLVPR